MINPRLFPSLGLIAVFLAACASSNEPVSSSQTANALTPTAVPVLATSTPAAMAATEAQAASPLPVATSRGPELHATDPTTVALASGGLQLVEFFRFT